MIFARSAKIIYNKLVVLTRLRQYFLPAPAALTMLWAALFWLAITLALSAVLGAATGDMSAAAIFWGVIGPPAAILFLLLGAWRELRYGPRAVLLGFSLALLVLTAAALAWAFGQAPADIAAGGFYIVACCFIPLALPLLGGAAFFAFKAWPQLRQVLRAARYARISQLLQARGEESYTELAGELSLPEAEVPALLKELVSSGELMAFLEPAGGRAYSTAAIAAKQRQAAAILTARGKAGLDALAAELGVPAELLSGWLRQLGQRGEFNGYVDWAARQVYTVEASTARQACPHCGGALDLAGKGVIQCANCAVELFL